MKAPADNVEDYAVVVGIKDYKTPWTPLDGPHADAQAFIDWLGKPGPDGGGLLDDHIFPVFGTPDATAPTALAIRETIVGLLRPATVDDPRVGRRLYVYVSGHGMAVMEGVELAGLVPPTHRKNDTFVVPAQLFVDAIRRAGHFDEIVWLMDCCRDNVTSVSAHALHPGIDDTPAPGRQTKTLLGYATQPGTKAYEVPFAGAPGKRGIFTRAVLDHLERGKRPLMASDFRKAVHLQMLAHPLANGQAPEVHVPDDFELVRGSAPRNELAPVTITLDAPIPRSFEVLDGRRQTVVTQTVDPARGSYTFHLPQPGLYIAVTQAPERRVFIDVMSNAEVICGL